MMTLVFSESCDKISNAIVQLVKRYYLKKIIIYNLNIVFLLCIDIFYIYSSQIICIYTVVPLPDPYDAIMYFDYKALVYHGKVSRNGHRMKISLSCYALFQDVFPNIYIVGPLKSIFSIWKLNNFRT